MGVASIMNCELRIMHCTLTLAELEATTCLWTSRLLSLDLAAVACHETFGAECLLVLGVNLSRERGQWRGEEPETDLCNRHHKG